MFSKKSIKKICSLSATFGVAVAALLSGAITGTAQTVPQQSKLFDFQGNNRTSFTTLAFPAGGPIRWKITGNPANPAPNAAFKREFDYGLTASDTLAVGDYTGDLKSEVVVYRNTSASAQGFFYVAQFPTGTAGITLERAVPFGNGFSDFAGMQGDYDGDGKADYTVVRINSSGTLVWYIMSSATGAMRAINFGTVTGLPNTNDAFTIFPGADFNGDGRDELIFVSRNATGTQVTYNIGDATTGAGLMTRVFGNFNSDFSLAPDDYTGDGRADFVAVRQTQGTQQVWYIQDSQTNTVTGTSFGIPNSDFPIRGDYDGDNRHDVAVWRRSNQTFYYISSQNGSIQSQKSGDATDIPLGFIGAY